MEKCCWFNSARVSSNRYKHECGTAITPSLGARTTAFVVGNGGAITITASPPITTTGMIVGQELKICGTDNTNTVTYNNSVNLVLTGSATLEKTSVLILCMLGQMGPICHGLKQGEASNEKDYIITIATDNGGACTI